MKHEQMITLLDRPDNSTVERQPTLNHRGFFRAVFGLLGLIPVITSTTALLLGSGRHVDLDTASVGLDSQLRYLGGVYFMLGLVVIYGAVNIDRAKMVATLAAGAIFIGGVGRLFSWFQVGQPDDVAVLFAGVELLVVPALVFFYRASFEASEAEVSL